MMDPSRRAAYEIAVLSNPQYPEHSQITISFSIPNDQYDKTIEMLQGMELGFSRNRDCTVDEADSCYHVLEALKDTLVNVDQLDYPGKAAGQFCTGEDAQFQTMAGKLDLVHIKDFINLTFCCQQAILVVCPQSFRFFRNMILNSFAKQILIPQKLKKYKDFRPKSSKFRIMESAILEDLTTCFCLTHRASVRYDNLRNTITK